MAFVFLCLTSLRVIISGSIHVAANGIILFFLWLFHCTCVPYLLYPLICRWKFGCCHVVAIVKSAAMSTGLHVSFRIIVFLDIYMLL